MALTDRSRLSCLKRKQKREQRKKIETQTSNLNSVAGLGTTLQPLLNVSTKEKAWKKYLHARAIYEETKDFQHWQYAQQCLTDYENAAG